MPGVGGAVCGGCRESQESSSFEDETRQTPLNFFCTLANYTLLPIMASICSRCALRIHRIATTESSTLPRTFSSTTARRVHAVPQFSETSNAELDNVLATMRDKHFIPAALTNAQRRLIFGHSKREELTNYPQAVDIAGEKVDLKWIDRRKEIPNRTKLFRQAIKLMAEDGSTEAWRNLLSLMVGLKRSGVEITKVEMERILRLASNTGHLPQILDCLRKGSETGMTLQRPEVLDGVLLALRKQGRADDWSQKSMERAMAYGRDVAQLLEMEMHGGRKHVSANDLRRDPRIIGLFLELSAVFAEMYQGGKDADGRVRAYAERLLYNMERVKEVSQPIHSHPLF